MSSHTKALIADTLLTLSKTKNVDQITVTDLVKACDISRQTFYYHFQDITDALEWSANQRFRQALTASLKSGSLEQAMQSFATPAIENQALLRRLLQSQKRARIEQVFVQGIQTYLWELFRHWPPTARLPYSELEWSVRFYSYGIAGIFLDYDGRSPADPQQLARQICRLLPFGEPLP